MPGLPAAQPHQFPPHLESPPMSPRHESSSESSLANACRELLQLHECEVRALRERFEELLKLQFQTADEDTLRGIAFPRIEQVLGSGQAVGASTVVPLQSQKTDEETTKDIASPRIDQVLGSGHAVVASTAVAVKRSRSLSSGFYESELDDADAIDDAPVRCTSSYSRPPSQRLTHIASDNKVVPTATDAGMLHRLVSGHRFEWLSCGMVFCNSLVVGFEEQYYGHSIGYALQYRNHVTPAEQQYPHGDAVLEALSWFFGMFFLIEIILRVCASFRKCVRDAWAWFDAFIMMAWIISKLSYVLPVDSTVLRLARWLRLLRLLKLARALQHFDSLFTIVTAIKACVGILFWTFVTFGLVQLLFSLVLTQYLHTFYFDATDNSSDQVLVFAYYGTFLRSYFSLWEITLGNWPPACRVLAEHVSEHFFTLGLIHRIVFGFALVAIINGVFIQETFKVTARDDVIMLRQKQAAMKHHAEKMRRLMNHTDTDNDGRVSLEEWDKVVKDAGVKSWLASMDLDVYDAKLIFRLCDYSGDGYLSFEELASGIWRFKGPAKNVDLHGLLRRAARSRRSSRISRASVIDAELDAWRM